jgi:NitT/TauT family transport system substrate-binding protein
MRVVTRRKAMQCLWGPIGFSAVVAPFRSALASTVHLRIAYQPSLNYLPLMVLEQEKIIETHLKRRGQEVEISWLRFTAGGPMNDALLSGQIDIASGGITVLALLWDKTQGRQNVFGLSSLASSPFFLNVNKPSIRTLSDFTDRDRIAVPMAKISPNAIVLQMATEKVFGKGQHEKLDFITLSMANPEAQAALQGRKTEISAHLCAPPFCFQELQQPGISRVLSSSEVLGDEATTIVTWTTSAFARANPELIQAFFLALQEANNIIAGDSGRAAAIYKAAMNASQPVEKLQALVEEPSISFNAAPKNSLRMVSFMHRVGMLKKMPADWKELFLPEAHALGGS